MTRELRATAVLPPPLAAPAAAPARRRLPPCLVWAAAGTFVAVALLLLDVRASGSGILRPIRAGDRGPGAAMVARDFPSAQLPKGVGLDGQQFYAIARDPFRPDAVASSLDSPQYRYQRPLYPLLAWALHPSGGGPGLVWAFVAVNVVALFAGALALGALSVRVHGPPWLALLYPLLPGALWALTSSVADALAVSLSLVVVVAMLEGRTRLACCAAVLAVLTRETTILVPLAVVLARRDRSDLPVAVAPALAIAAWLVVVRVVVPGGGLPHEHLVLPFTGLVDAARSRWLLGKELIGMASTLAAFVVAAYVLARGKGPVELRWVVGLQVAFLSLCSGAVLGDDFGGTRSTLMMLAVGVVILVAGTRSPRPGVPALR